MQRRVDEMCALSRQQASSLWVGGVTRVEGEVNSEFTRATAAYQEVRDKKANPHLGTVPEPAPKQAATQDP